MKPYTWMAALWSVSLSALGSAPSDGRWQADTRVVDAGVYSACNLGEAQGGSYIDGKIYLYGDLYRETPRVGIIREYDANLVPTGRVLRLTRGSEPLAVHPTGFSRDARFGTLLGDTVDGIGTIYALDWDRAWTNGNLDGAVTAIVRDDAAVNGTRPLFVEVGNRTLVATADYGDKSPELRLYDPAKLLQTGRSSTPGVVVSRLAAGSFTQNLAWDPGTGRLTFVQNVIAGRGWRLDTVNLAAALKAGSLTAPRVRVGTRIYPPHDELEGYFRMPDGREIFVTSSETDNIVAGRSRATVPRWTEPGTWQVDLSGTVRRRPAHRPCERPHGRLARLR